MNMEYASHKTKNIPQAMQAFVNDALAKGSSSNKGAIITIAGKLESTYIVDDGVIKFGSISFIKIIPLEAVPVSVPKAIKNVSCSKPLKQCLETLRIYTKVISAPTIVKIIIGNM